MTPARFCTKPLAATAVDADMQRRNFLKTAGMGAIAGTFGIAAAPEAGAADKKPASATPGKLRGYPVLMNPTQDSIFVMWLTEGDCTGLVQYGDAPDKLDRTVAAHRMGIAVKSSVHRVRLTGIEPGKTVHYRVVTRKAVRAGENLATSATYAFTLPKKDASELRFVQINDTHENFPVIDRLLARIDALKPDFFIWNGDIFNAVGDAEHIAKNIFLPVDRPFAATIPMVYARGNHDVRGRAAELLDFIAMPEGTTYYTFRQGPAGFVVLDTAEDKEDARLFSGACFEPFKDEETAWLPGALKRPEITEAPVKIGVFHIPFWSRGDWPGVDCRNRWLKHLEKAGVKFLICGHMHVYEYLTPGETTKQTNDPDAAPVSITQLIGGGPSESNARLIIASVKAGEITIKTENVAGKVVANHTVKC